MGSMAVRKLDRIQIDAITIVALVIYAATFIGVPLAMIVVGSDLNHPRPSGFGQEVRVLLQLLIRSVILAGVGAFGATCIATTSSSIALFVPLFGKFYRTWLIVMLLTNPVFLVLGFSTILADWPPIPSVVLSTIFILLPFVGLVVHSGVGGFPRSQISAALSLGAGPWTILRAHVIGRAMPQITLGLLLGSVYAFGFYLLPTYVGLGRVVTVGTAINTAANRVGDWTAAQQLASLALICEVVAVLIWLGSRSVLSSKAFGDR